MNIELSEKEIALLRKYTSYAHMKYAYPNSDLRMHIAKEDLKESSLLFEKLSKALNISPMDIPVSEMTEKIGVPQE